MSFRLDPKLAADTTLVCDLALSRVLLMNDRRYDWLILVPRRAGLTEIVDLSPAERAELMEETARCVQVLRGIEGVEKVNVGALGNMVRQLHVHVVARRVDDAAWPLPVWGAGAAVAYGEGEAAARAAEFKQCLGLGEGKTRSKVFAPSTVVNTLSSILDGMTERWSESQIMELRPMTPALLALYSTLLGLAAVTVSAAISVVFALIAGALRADAEPIALATSTLLAISSTCFLIYGFLKAAVTSSKIQIVNREGQPKIVSIGIALGFLFGAFWRVMIASVVTQVAVSIFEDALGANMTLTHPLIIDLLVFTCNWYLSFWWVYAAPYGTHRILTEPSKFAKAVPSILSSVEIIDQDDFRDRLLSRK